MSADPPVTVICVFNDADMRVSCLDRSIEEHRSEMPEVDYIPVDNTDGRFASAGEALNHGARRARHDYIAFVHQDVYLHSLASLGRVAAAMRAGGVGVVGAVGVAADGGVVGRMRDRVVVIGDPASSPRDVDSVDEVLFMVPTAQVHDAPLTEAPEFAWHAYAVEYGLRMRTQGMRVTAMDMAITHNSMSTNLARLQEAHAEIARLYPGEIPIRTTCGVVRAQGSGSRLPRVLQGHRWRYRWLRNSIRARSVQAAAGGAPVVLNDIRMDIDSFLANLHSPLTVVNVDRGGATPDPLAEQVRLPRGASEVAFELMDVSAASLLVNATGGRESLLLTNLTVADLQALRRPLSEHPRLVGFHDDLGCWALAGVPEDDRWLWERRGAVPLLAARP